MNDTDSVPQLPTRSHPAHGVLGNGRNTVVFLTVCTHERARWLASPEVHDGLRGVWESSRAWLVGGYVLMPDHLHLFAAPGEIDLPFDNWVRFWKSRFTKLHGRPGCRWQVDHWDRRMRHGDSYDDALIYVRNNPVRAGLVSDSTDWPYQGTLNVLSWD